MRNCVKCGEPRNAEAFYASNKSQCKECVKSAVKRNREEKSEYYKAYDRARSWTPDRVEARKRRQKRAKVDPVMRARDAEHKRQWLDRNAMKRLCHIEAGNAMRDGKLVPQPCERCGHAANAQAHHEDYSKPLDVVWLCPPCHGLRHREINAERRTA